MVQVLIGWAIKRWLWLAIIGALAGGWSWTAIHYYQKGKQAEITRNLNELQKIQNTREGIDEKLDNLDGRELDDQLRRWVQPAPSGSNP